MLKLYHKYLINKFMNNFLKMTAIFFFLILVLSILEEISFFKNLDENIFYPYLLTLLNAPITLFEIFPFIFLLSTQFLFNDLNNSQETILLKKNGLSNLKIIKIVFFLSLVIGIFNVLIVYNLSTALKFQYSNIKNNFSKDNKYLAMVTESGLWIKDEINDKIFIIKSKLINKQYLLQTIINEFDLEFTLQRVIQSEKVDISDKNWIVFKPTITINNTDEVSNQTINLETNFDSKKIYNLFSDVYTFDLIKLFNLKKDYEKLGYSSDEIKIHILKIISVPILYGLLTTLSSIIMLGFTKNKPLILNIIIGILISVIIYYINFIFSALGASGKIPILASIFFPLLFLSIIIIIGLININEK